MYIWKITELKEQLISRGLSEAESFKYVLANSILLTVATIQYGETNQYDTLNGFIALLSTILCTWIAYKVNGGKDGNQFVYRYLAICWVVFVRFFVFVVLPVIIAKLAIEEIYLGGAPAATTLSDVFFTAVMEILYVAIVTKHISHIAKAADVVPI